jgi:hypothetical protein
MGERERRTVDFGNMRFPVLAAISTLALPFAWHKQANVRQHIAKLPSTMATIYNELKSDGLISAQYI